MTGTCARPQNRRGDGASSLTGTKITAPSPASAESAAPRRRPGSVPRREVNRVLLDRPPEAPSAHLPATAAAGAATTEVADVERPIVRPAARLLRSRLPTRRGHREFARDRVRAGSSRRGGAQAESQVDSATRMRCAGASWSHRRASARQFFTVNVTRSSSSNMRNLGVQRGRRHSTNEPSIDDTTASRSTWGVWSAQSIIANREVVAPHCDQRE
jgi:hypothetical protein